MENGVGWGWNIPVLSQSCLVLFCPVLQPDTGKKMTENGDPGIGRCCRARIDNLDDAKVVLLVMVVVTNDGGGGRWRRGIASAIDVAVGK